MELEAHVPHVFVLVLVVVRFLHFSQVKCGRQGLPRLLVVMVESILIASCLLYQLSNLLAAKPNR